MIKNNKDPQPKQEPAPAPSTTPTTTSVNTPAAPAAGFGPGLPGLGGIAGLSAMSAQNPQLFEQAQQHLLQHPELMTQLMNSPAIQGIISNPDIFREFFLNNSQVSTFDAKVSQQIVQKQLLSVTG